jgi:hypothetical protein
MASQAQVTSVEAIDRFRSQLIIFCEKAKMALDDVLDEAGRTRRWLENDQRLAWHARARKYSKELETAQQQEFSARISQLATNATAQKMAVARARRGLREAEEKIVLLRRWLQRYDGEIAGSRVQVEKLRAFVAVDLRDGVALLSRTLEALEAYAMTGVPSGRGGGGPAPPPAGGAA